MDDPTRFSGRDRTPHNRLLAGVFGLIVVGLVITACHLIQYY
jgi:hypothetical protein